VNQKNHLYQKLTLKGGGWSFPFKLRDSNLDASIAIESDTVFNPLVEPFPRWYEFYKRVKLIPWWLRYNFGITRESILKDKIIELGKALWLNRADAHRLIQHAVSEFSKNGLGSDYYGYHNINHELEVTYFTLLAARGQQDQNKFSQKDIRTLFAAALFHDYDPLKRFDKPHEANVESFIRNDNKIKELIQPFQIDLDVVIALIYRTAYPFKGSVAEHALKRMNDLFTKSGISSSDSSTRSHYIELGWFLSICDRLAGYCLGNFEYSQELARLNAHAMAWHPSVINQRSVTYFTELKAEKNMVDRVLNAIPENFKKNFYDNVAGFRQAWENEVQIRAMLRRKEMNLVIEVEGTGDLMNPDLITSVTKLYMEIPAPISPNEKDFNRSFLTNKTILITLRTNEQGRTIVGYVKGGPLEKYKLRKGTVDVNFGKRNTVYMEWIRIKPEYWGETGGHLLRYGFIKEARNRGYEFVSSYVHRDVIKGRMNKGEPIEIVQKYDPDRLDYYRTDLLKSVKPLASM
jgi:hypothetical protein